MMKVLTKNVLIEDEEFVLITDEHEGRKFYGTIPYSELENGKIKRELNGFELCIDWVNTTNALENRRKDILFKRFKNEGKHTEAELIEYFLSL